MTFITRWLVTTFQNASALFCILWISVTFFQSYISSLKNYKKNGVKILSCIVSSIGLGSELCTFNWTHWPNYICTIEYRFTLNQTVPNSFYEYSNITDNGRQRQRQLWHNVNNNSINDLQFLYSYWCKHAYSTEKRYRWIPAPNVNG